MAGTSEIRSRLDLRGHGPVIFVTVGTTHFDSLIREIDRLVACGLIADRVVCQYGAGKYVPTHVEGFTFQPTIEHWLDSADLVICHGGSTVLAMLQRGKRFVAIANTDLAGDHQSKMLTKLAQIAGFPWSRDVKDLEQLIARALSSPVPHLELPQLGDTLRRMV